MDGRRRRWPLPVAMLGLIAVAAAAVAYRTVTYQPRIPDRGSVPYRAVLINDRSAIEACVGLPPGELGGDREGTEGIVEDVETIRDLRFRSPPSPRVLSEEDVAELLGAAPLGPPGRRRLEGELRILSVLGVGGAIDEIRQLLDPTGLPSGLYRREHGPLVVDPIADLDPVERSILAHELAHALVDEILGLPLPYGFRHDDETLALAALVEGDASLVEERYRAWRLGPLDRLAFTPLASGSAGTDVPDYLARRFTFPYVQGLAFVCELYERGGWDAVNAAHRAPPQTSAEILFPDRFFEDVPVVRPSAPLVPGRRWALEYGRSLGAAELWWMFTAPRGNPSVGLSNPLDRAAGWAGGEIRLWARDDGMSAVVLSLAQRPREERLCDSMTRWFWEMHPAADLRKLRAHEKAAAPFSGVVACREGEVRVAITPRLGVARRLTAWR